MTPEQMILDTLTGWGPDAEIILEGVDMRALAEEMKALRAELERVRQVANEVFDAVVSWGHGYDCGTDYGKACDCPVGAVERARERIEKGVGND